MNICDIVVGLDEVGMMVVVVLIYVKNIGSLVVEDLFWINMIGDDVGGVMCVCIVG